MVRDVTTVEFKRKTKARMAARGRKGDSYDDIANAIMDKVNGCAQCSDEQREKCHRELLKLRQEKEGK